MSDDVVHSQLIDDTRSVTKSVILSITDYSEKPKSEDVPLDRERTREMENLEP